MPEFELLALLILFGNKALYYWDLVGFLLWRGVGMMVLFCLVMLLWLHISSLWQSE